VTAACLGSDWHIPLLMAPLAASSVILFGLPASPLARPWAVIVGHIVSALAGVTVAHWVPNLMVASGLSVAVSILAMTLTRSLHPPGGSTALIAVVGGPAVAAAGYSYAWVPVGANALLLVVIGMVYHRLITGHRYPHAISRPLPTPTAEPPVEIRPEDIDAAVSRYGEVLDLDRDDVEILVREVEQAAARRRAKLNDAG
jgi:CBS domain-containing membrane protein